MAEPAMPAGPFIKSTMSALTRAGRFHWIPDRAFAVSLSALLRRHARVDQSRFSTRSDDSSAAKTLAYAGCAIPRIAECRLYLCAK
jgi:hypothetical protein